MRAAVVLLGSALVLALWTIALAEPTVTIYTDADTYQSGDTIEVTLGVENPDGSTTLDLCIGLLMPDGSIYTMGPSGWVQTIVPWNAEVRMPGQFDMTAHFRFEVPSVLPAPPISQGGEYYFASLCLDPGTWGWASNFSLAPFSYSSGGPSTDVTMVPIAAGSFLMGSPDDELRRDPDEGPQRTVNISAFQMSETEVTQKQFEDVMGWNDSYFSGDDHPVERVTWFDCVSFCNELSEADGYTKCYTISNIGYDGDHITSAEVTCNFGANGYRLPTEAEWEYACRAGTTTRFYTGDSDPDLRRAGWYFNNSGQTTHPVGEKERNAWGLYDMHGNVWEWCWDWYSSRYYGTRPDPDSDPTGASSGAVRVLRGGGWYGLTWSCRSAGRDWPEPGYGYYGYGFRVARSSN
ncbi:MAG TPA: formylglycine-generating enzyme family protein [bacterium]|nr:formylglycine-generating enzyme family protein [bacterium]